MWVTIRMFNKSIFSERHVECCSVFKIHKTGLLVAYRENTAKKEGEHACFVFHNLLQDVCQGALIFTHLCWPLYWYPPQMLCFTLPCCSPSEISSFTRVHKVDTSMTHQG